LAVCQGRKWAYIGSLESSCRLKNLLIMMVQRKCRGHVCVGFCLAKSVFDLPYRSETECMERALSFHGLKPDILLSLGGEAFSVYPMKDGMIANVISTSKCAAGTGEFIVQQLQRMGLSLEQGLEEAPKVLIIGGLNLLFVHEPVTRYLLEQGILPKVVSYSEGVCWFASEPVVRYGFKKGPDVPAGLSVVQETRGGVSRSCLPRPLSRRRRTACPYRPKNTVPPRPRAPHEGFRSHGQQPSHKGLGPDL